MKRGPWNWIEEFGLYSQLHNRDGIKGFWVLYPDTDQAHLFAFRPAESIDSGYIRSFDLRTDTVYYLHYVIGTTDYILKERHAHNVRDFVLNLDTGYVPPVPHYRDFTPTYPPPPMPDPLGVAKEMAAIDHRRAVANTLDQMNDIPRTLWPDWYQPIDNKRPL